MYLSTRVKNLVDVSFILHPHVFRPQVLCYVLSDSFPSDITSDVTKGGAHFRKAVILSF